MSSTDTPSTDLSPRPRPTRTLSRAARVVPPAGDVLVRYGLVIVLAWIGLLKFTTYEAEAIVPLVSSHPLMSWVYQILGVPGFAALLGTVEVAAAVLIALHFLSPRASAVGSAVAALLFLGTLSFLLTLPASATGGFPFLSVTVGQFLIKDLVLFGAAAWTLGDALRAAFPVSSQAGA